MDRRNVKVEARAAVDLAVVEAFGQHLALLRTAKDQRERPSFAGAKRIFGFADDAIEDERMARVSEMKNLADMRLEMFDAKRRGVCAALSCASASLFTPMRVSQLQARVIVTYRCRNFQGARDMGEETREIDGPGGPYRLRPAQPADEAISVRFVPRASSRHVPARRAAGADDRKPVDLAISRARTKLSWSFPNARWSIVECAGEPIGELIIDEETEALHIVDITLAPERQGRGNRPRADPRCFERRRIAWRGPRYGRHRQCAVTEDVRSPRLRREPLRRRGQRGVAMASVREKRERARDPRPGAAPPLSRRAPGPPAGSG